MDFFRGGGVTCIKVWGFALLVLSRVFLNIQWK